MWTRWMLLLTLVGLLASGTGCFTDPIDSPYPPPPPPESILDVGGR